LWPGRSIRPPATAQTGPGLRIGPVSAMFFLAESQVLPLTKKQKEEKSLEIVLCIFLGAQKEKLRNL